MSLNHETFGLRVKLHSIHVSHNVALRINIPYVSSQLVLRFLFLFFFFFLELTIPLLFTVLGTGEFMTVPIISHIVWRLNADTLHTM